MSMSMTMIAEKEMDVWPAGIMIHDKRRKVTQGDDDYDDYDYDIENVI